jgi:hypothetical protein
VIQVPLAFRIWKVPVPLQPGQLMEGRYLGVAGAFSQGT